MTGFTETLKTGGSTIALVASLIITSPALAQAQATSDTSTSAADDTAVSGDDAPNAPEIVVSGTRIVRDGYNAPTPVTVIGEDQLQSSATPNIADYVNTLPIFNGSTTPASGYHNSSSGLAGLNTLNLRNLGAARTLVLLDGQRSVGSTTTGLVDINTIPQDLVERVDVVTGGASAVYGSDALSGAVNFVLNKTYEGTKAQISGGITDYGDDPNWKVSVTHGMAFAEDRGHLIVSGQISNDYGIKGVPRDWNNTGEAYMVNPAYAAGNGAPQYIRVNQATLYTATFGGIITSGPLAQTAFGPGGTPYTFHLGQLTANPYTSGGADWASNQTNVKQNLIPRQNDQRLFGRLSFQITDNINIFGQASWAKYHSIGVNEPVFFLGNLTIQADNAFLPATIAEKLASLGQTDFKFGTLNGDLPDWKNDARRKTTRYVVGADGDFGALGSDWNWSAYYQKGRTDAKFQLTVPVNARYREAIDAVVDPDTGSIVCRSTLTNPTNGCVPYNVFGTGVATEAAINYVEPTDPTQILVVKQDVFAADVSGDPISTWAGPVSLALGFEHRREATKATPDANAGSYFAGNFAQIEGSYTVTEGSIETVVPLARDQAWARQFDINAAVRFTDYSYSGFVTTWKLGATWDVFDGLRLRATRSRDIRAPNLSELFQAGAGGTATIFDSFRGRQPVPYRVIQQGNLDLKPEKADSLGFGVVLQPGFLPGFSASADYWDIKIKGAIGGVGSQSAFDLCFEGNKLLCSLISPDPSTLSSIPESYNIISQPINLASQKARGIDFEAGYRFDLDTLISGVGGSLNLRYLGTHYIDNTTDNLLVPPVNAVGSGIPKWRHNITAQYANGPFSGLLTARGFSAGKISNRFIVCENNCPASDPQNPTVSNADQPSAFYFDASLNYTIENSSGTSYQLFLNIQNLFNKDPAIVPLPYDGVVPYFSLQTDPQLYDLLGRRYQVGIRFKM